MLPTIPQTKHKNPFEHLYEIYDRYLDSIIPNNDGFGMYKALILAQKGEIVIESVFEDKDECTIEYRTKDGKNGERIFKIK